MRFVLALAALAACGSSSNADVPAPLPTEPVVREVVPTFRLLTDRERDDRAAALAKSFPAADHARVVLDLAGFIDRIELAGPIPKPAGEFLLATVRAHARDFGVADPDALHIYTTDHDVILGTPGRWTGSIHMSTWTNTISIWGHLWPVATPAAPPPVDRARLLAPYVGLQGSQPCKCIGRDTVGLTTTAGMFELRTGVALVCADGALHPRPAIALRFNGNGRVPALAKLPTLFDARTLEPIDADYLMPPSNNVEVHDITGGFSDFHHGCLRPRLDSPPHG